MPFQLKPGELKVIKPEVASTGIIRADVDVLTF